jgi:ribosomal protein S18 acetylase RimI-like enzyme/predicted transcriptional regulator/predicted nucleic acid-binding protein
MSAQLVRPDAGDATYRGVLALAKQARKTVGFLTDSAFAQRACQGTLLAALHEQQVAGYLLYDLPRDEIRIVHLVVAQQYQGQGLARAMVDAIADDHAERRGILLHCRNDFPADGLWPKLDFVPLGERTGRNIEGKPLTRWFRSFGRPDLFTILHEQDSRPVALMDACVFFDLVGPTPSTVAQQLRADWLGEHVRLGVTDQLLFEIHQGADGAERRRQSAAADPLRLATNSQAGWKTIRRSLLARHPDAPDKDRNDLTYLAQAIAAQASWLITSDRAFVRRYTNTAAAFGVGLVLPSAFLRNVDEQASGDRYRPVDLAGTAVTRRHAEASVLASLAPAFVNHPAGERIRDLRETIDVAAARPADVRLELIDVDGGPRGLVCWQLDEDTLEVLLIRVRSGKGETTIGRHLLGLVRDEAVASQLETIRILDRRPSPSVLRSFRDEGFAVDGGGKVVAHALAGRGTFADLHERARAVGSPLAATDLFQDESGDIAVRAAAAERWFAPFRVLGAGIPCFILPIQHGWATELLDVGLAQEQLLPRDWGLGLRRELVYYRSPRNAGGLAPPARLLWYVSGSARGAGTIRAVSHLTEVAVDDHARLASRFKALGVYSSEQVAARADSRGKAMALRFSHTERFRCPVTLDDYRELVSGDPKSKQVVLRSARRIGEHTFVSLLDMGAGADA